MARKRKKELSMRKVREILRLSLECHMGKREVARSCTVSPTTVTNYLSRIEKLNLNYSQVARMDDEELKRILLSHKSSSQGKLRPQPNCRAGGRS